MTLNLGTRADLSHLAGKTRAQLAALPMATTGKKIIMYKWSVSPVLSNEEKKSNIP